MLKMHRCCIATRCIQVFFLPNTMYNTTAELPTRIKTPCYLQTLLCLIRLTEHNISGVQRWNLEYIFPSQVATKMLAPCPVYGQVTCYAKRNTSLCRQYPSLHQGRVFPRTNSPIKIVCYRPQELQKILLGHPPDKHGLQIPYTVL